MAVKLSSLAVDLEGDEKGTWVPSLQYAGVEYRLSSVYLPAYVTARQQLLQRLNRKYQGAVVPPLEMGSELGKLLAQHLLHEWKGFDVPYTEEVALERLVNPAFRPLRADIDECASRIGVPDVEYIEEQGKN